MKEILKIIQRVNEGNFEKLHRGLMKEIFKIIPRVHEGLTEFVSQYMVPVAAVEVP